MDVKDVKKSRGLWEVNVDGNAIKVENGPGAVKLFVNEKLQDIYLIFVGCPHLYGRLSNGKKVKVSVGGDLKVHCYIFVEDELVLED